MAKDKILYEETYRPGALKVRDSLLPERFPYMEPEAKIVSIEVRKLGRLERNGEELEYQDVRVYVRMPKES